MFSSYILGVKSNFRGKLLIEQLEKCRIYPTVVWGPDLAIDQLLIDAHTNQEFANFSIRRDIKPQEIACCLGHLSMYQIFLESGFEWGLFLEDDAIFRKDPTQLILELPVANDAIQIFIHDGPGTNFGYGRDLIVGGTRLKRRLDPQYGAYGYLLNKAATEMILHAPLNEFINTPDWPYFWPKEIKFYVCDEIYFSHPQDSDVSIIGERVNAKATLKNQLPSFSRVISGLRFTSDIRFLVYKEINQKLIRIYLKIKRKFSK